MSNTVELTPTVIAVEAHPSAYNFKIELSGKVQYKEYPCLSYNADEQTTLWKPIPAGYTIIGLLKDCLNSETLAEKVVDYCNYTDECGYEEQHYYLGYPDYEGGLDEYGRWETLTDSRIESLQSLCTSKSLDTTKNWLLLTK